MVAFEDAQRTRLGRTGEWLVSADESLSWEGTLAPQGSTSASQTDVAGDLDQDFVFMELSPKHLVVRGICLAHPSHEVLLIVRSQVWIWEKRPFVSGD
jgi:hypothetical protein